jgi:hypothetical protein
MSCMSTQINRMSTRLTAFFVAFAVFAAMLGFIAYPVLSKPTLSSSGPSVRTPASSSRVGIQSKARVFDLADPRGLTKNGSTKVGIMAAYDPKSHAFWWRPAPFIAESSMLERYFERCQFLPDGNQLLNFCVRENDVVVTTTSDFAQSLDQGLDAAQAQLQSNPGLLLGYRGPRDGGFNLQKKAGVDMNTAVGVPPTVVRSVTKTPTGWDLNVSCGCGDAVISLDKNYDFLDLRHI